MERLLPPGAGLAMSASYREMVFLILQFLDEEKFKESVHKLEQESGFFFDIKYFEDQVEAGEWEEVERYLSGFIKLNDSDGSRTIYFEIRKQKYLEALDSQDRSKAIEILVKDLGVFASEENHFKEMTQLLTLDNFRQNDKLSTYGDTMSQRKALMTILRGHIELNPLLCGKLKFPALKASSLRALINQSLIQHEICKNTNPSPDMKTLSTNYTRTSNKRNHVPASNTTLTKLIPRRSVLPLTGHHSFQPVIPIPIGNASWMYVNRSHDVHRVDNHLSLVRSPRSVALFNHPRNSHGMEYQATNSQHLVKRLCFAQPDEASRSGSTHSADVYSADDLPKIVVQKLGQGSCFVTSMDFHPQTQNFLLVGTTLGKITIWDVGSGKKVRERLFMVWNISACSTPFQTTLKEHNSLPVNRCAWSPDGSKLGVAFSIHIVQIYKYNSEGNLLQQHLEIDAHVGGVNDIVFVNPNNQPRILTCGDDKTIKIWDADSGERHHTFEGHEAPVCSICPQYNWPARIFYSTSTDGKIKAWRLYDSFKSIANFDTPGLWYSRLTYNADETRIFCCVTSKQGECQLAEWCEREGVIKRTYPGCTNVPLCTDRDTVFPEPGRILQFDTITNRFLAAGDECRIKFWDMDNVNELGCIDSKFQLHGQPQIRVNKAGSLLSVTTFDGGFLILANADMQRILKMMESISSNRDHDLSKQGNAQATMESRGG